ncbi:ribonuclease H-like domain-containing protein [Tanacetum coccineum]
MDVPIEQDDLNHKFLSSLAPEWLVYIIVWRNMDDLDTMSLDDVYNHLKVYEPEVLKRVSTTSVQVSTASTDFAAANISYDTVCAFRATQPNGSQIKYEDITHIDDDDIEEMDIKWNLALLSIRADRSLRSQDRGKKESYKKDPKVEEPAPKAMMAIDGIGWDWSYMAEEDENHALVADEEEVLTEYALMAKSSSSLDKDVYDDSFCSKSCRKNTENLNNKIIKLNKECSDCETDLYNYKRGLSQVEARLVKFKENEIKFYKRIRVLERDIEIRDNKIENLRNELEEVKKEKESIDFKIEKFDNALKDLDSLLGNQRLDKDREGLGFNEYSVVPPPHLLRKICLGWVYLSLLMTLSLIIVGLHLDSEDESEVESTPNKTVRPSIEQVKFDKSTREIVGKKETPKQNKNQPRGNQRNWNNQKSQQLGKDFVMQNKACYNCGSFEHLKFDCKQNILVNKGKTWTRGIPQDNIDDKRYWDSGCSRHMTGNISYLSEYEPYNGGYVSFGHGGGNIIGKGTIKTGKLEFENVYFVKELKYNMFSVSQICDNKNSVLFTDSECLVLGKDFKLADDTHVLLRTPRHQNMYSIDLKNIVPHKNLTSLFMVLKNIVPQKIRPSEL